MTEDEMNERVIRLSAKAAEYAEKCEAKFTKLLTPRFKEPKVKREVISRAPWRKVLHAIWCWVFGHDWDTMHGEEPEPRMEVCRRCGRVVQAEGGWNPALIIDDIVASTPMTAGMFDAWAKSIQDRFKHGDSFTKLTYKQEPYGRRSVAQR